MKKLDYEKYNAEQITTRFSKAKGDKNNWDTVLKDCYKYFMPARNSYDSPAQGQDDRKHIFDGTAEQTMVSFAALMQQGLVPPWQKWATLVSGTDIPTEQKEEFDKELALLSDTLMQSIWYSNFDSQVMEMFYDLAIGTGAMLIHNTNDPADPLRFESVPLNEVFPEEGAYGDIDTIFREFTMKYRNIEQRWSKATISTKLRRHIDKNPDTSVKVIEGTIYNPKSKSYTYSVVVDNDVIYEAGLPSSPWVTPRWDKRSGETLGRGPAMNALADVKTLNQVKKYAMMNAEMAVSNIYTVVDDGVLNFSNVTLEPNTLIPVASNGGGELGASISALPRSGDFNVSTFVVNDLRSSIREAMFANSLGDIANAPVRSATEIQIRTNMLLQQAGAVIGRLQTEFVNKLIKRVYFILSENGILPAGLSVDDKILSVRVDSPLADGRKSEEVNAYLGWLQTTAQINPNAPALLVQPSNITWMAKQMGVPLDQVPTTEELQEKLAQLAQTLQQQQQTQEG